MIGSETRTREQFNALDLVTLRLVFELRLKKQLRKNLSPEDSQPLSGFVSNELVYILANEIFGKHLSTGGSR